MKQFRPLTCIHNCNPYSQYHVPSRNFQNYYITPRRFHRSLSSATILAAKTLFGVLARVRRVHDTVSLLFIILAICMYTTCASAEIQTSSFEYDGNLTPPTLPEHATFSYFNSDSKEVWWDYRGQEDGTNNTGEAGIHSGGLLQDLHTRFEESYVPVSGAFDLRLYFCSVGTKRDTCSIENSNGHYDSSSAALNTSETISSQNPIFRYGTGTDIPPLSAICYTFHDISSGTDYKTAATRTCQDGNILPDHPLNCTINEGSSLTIPLGTIKRSALETLPNAKYTISKTINVTCEGDKAINTETTFKYNELDDDSGASSTSTAGLGVAIQYQGKPVSPSHMISDEFQPGTNAIKLAFAPIRSSKVATNEIATGDFTSDVVMIITQL